MKCIEKGKPKNKNKIRQNEKKHLPISPFIFPYHSPPHSPPPLSPSPAMVRENAPSRYPPYIDNKGGWHYPLHDNGEGGNGPRQPQLRWRQCPRPRGISSPPPPPLPSRRQPFLAVVVHAQDNEDNDRSLSTITVVSIIVVHHKDHQKCIQWAFCPPLSSHFAFAKLPPTLSSWPLPPCFHCCHIYCHAAVVMLPLPTN